MNEQLQANNEAKDFVDAHIGELCQELIGMYDTGVMKGHCFRELQAICNKFAAPHGMQVAESRIQRRAMEIVADLFGPEETK
jgi:hypothetical protein